MKKIYLTKSNYCNCVQCEKILWLDKYKPSDSTIDNNELILEKGRRVGEFAKKLFGNYEEIQYDKDINVRLKETKKLLENKPNIIAEASFNYNNNFCSVDILKNDLDGVEIYEVKSSTKLKDIYLDDAAYQYFILSNLGLKVKKVCVVYINKEYIRGEKLDINQVFNVEDITKIAKDKQDEIKNNIDFINSYMESHD